MVYLGLISGLISGVIDFTSIVAPLRVAGGMSRAYTQQVWMKPNLSLYFMVGESLFNEVLAAPCRVAASEYLAVLGFTTDR